MKMKLVGLMPVRNEDWILGLSARAALMWCDALVILDHASTDDTRAIALEIADEHPGRIAIMTEVGCEWEEMRHRQALLSRARFEGATHIALIDADEVLTGNLLPSIRDHIERAPAGTVLQFPWLCLKDSIHQVITTGMWASQNVSTAFRDDPRAHWAARDGYDFHHRHPMGMPFVPCTPLGVARTGGLMHLQFVSRRRLLAKQALYQALEVLRWPGRTTPAAIRAMYGQTVRESETAQSSLVPASWWEPYEHLLCHLDPEAEPWQEEELRRLVAEHGRERFTGLDFFGL